MVSTLASPGTVAAATPTVTTAIATASTSSCALLADRTVRCWGLNEFGQLGDGTTTDRLTPVAVTGISTATAIIGGGGHSSPCSPTAASAAGVGTGAASSATAPGQTSSPRSR